MTTEITSTPIPGNAQEALTALRAEYPEVDVHLQYNRGWQLHASGPYGTLHVSLPAPVRSGTVRLACKMVTQDNLGGDAA